MIRYEIRQLAHGGIFCALVVEYEYNSMSELVNWVTWLYTEEDVRTLMEVHTRPIEVTGCQE